MHVFVRPLIGVLLLCSAASVRAQLVAEPSPVAFGGVQVHTQVHRVIAWRNTGSQPVTVDDRTSINQEFVVVGGNCSRFFPVAPQGTCTVEVLFMPTREQPYSDTMTMLSSGQSVGQVHLTGTGVRGLLDIVPSTAVSFPTTPVGATSAERTVQLASIGSGPVRVTSIATANSPFARVGGTCATPPFVLASGAACSLIYTYSPVEIGTGQRQVVPVQVPAEYGPSFFLTLQGDATQGTQTITFPAQPARIYGPGYGFPINPPATSNSNLPITYGSTTPTVCTVSASNVAVVAAGTCTLTANQAGNASWAAAAQRTQSFNIARASQTLTFPAQAVGSRTLVPGGTFAIAPIATSATPNAGQAIVYSSLDPAVCTVNGTTVTMVAFGTCTLAANQAGNANYNAATQVVTRVQLALFAHGFEVTVQP